MYFHFINLWSVNLWIWTGPAILNLISIYTWIGNCRRKDCYFQYLWVIVHSAMPGCPTSPCVGVWQARWPRWGFCSLSSTFWAADWAMPPSLPPVRCCPANTVFSLHQEQNSSALMLRIRSGVGGTTDILYTVQTTEYHYEVHGFGSSQKGCS